MICCRSLLPWILLLSIAGVGAFVPRKDESARLAKRDSGRCKLSPNLSANPNDLESPEERERRMELVRRLQKCFYQGESGVHLDDMHRGAGIIENVPLFRVQWTELPGSQNVLNCHEPHCTHMFMRVVSGPEPWYFGHLYLPGGSENLSNPEYQLGVPNSKAATIGTLMRVSDYRQLEDGRLLLLVQALSRFRVVEATQHALYGVATVELLPDTELVEAHIDEAMDMAVGGLDFCGAARAAAFAEDRHWQDFEFQRVSMDDSDFDGNIPPLATFDAGKITDAALNVEEVMEEYLREPHTDESLFECPVKYSGSTDNVLELEHNIWVGIDEMVRLLKAVIPNQKVMMPIPAQMLGLLPQNPQRPWPKSFALDKYATAVGILSPKSPYVATDAVTPPYPDLRRVERLAFIVWLLLDSVVMGPMGVLSRQDVLEMESVSERLEAAKGQLATINLALRQSLKKSR